MNSVIRFVVGLVLALSLAVGAFAVEHGSSVALNHSHSIKLACGHLMEPPCFSPLNLS